jgi:rare lipoprotein A
MRFEPINMGLPRTTIGSAEVAPRALAPRKKYFARASFAARLIASAALFHALFTLSSCGSRRAPAPVPAARVGASQEGVASWYGEPYHGRRAANGELYDMEQFTAAHPSLPFETWVRVRHLGNSKNTDVRITDRGPFVKNRIIDLSRAAAREIDLIRDGTARVRVTVIEPPKSYLRGRQFTVQVSSLAAKDRAERLQRQLAARHKDVTVRYRPANPKGGHAESWRVLVGREASPDAARRVLESVQDQFPNAFVVPFDVD